MAADNRNPQSPNHKPLSIATRTSLIDGLKSQSQERWTEFVQIYLPLLRYWTKQRGIPESLVDDMVQESLAAICKSIGGFQRQPTSKFRAWLRIIVQRRVADHFRRQNPKEAGLLDEMSHFPEPEESDPEDESTGGKAARREAALRAFGIIQKQVKPATWEMFWQSFVEQRPTDAIAREFGVSQDAVRNARHRVLRKLKAVAIEVEDLGR